MSPSLPGYKLQSPLAVRGVMMVTGEHQWMDARAFNIDGERMRKVEEGYYNNKQ